MNLATDNGIDGFHFDSLAGASVTSNTANSNAQDGFDLDAFTDGLFSNNDANNNVSDGYEGPAVNPPATAVGNTGAGNGANDTYP